MKKAALLLLFLLLCPLTALGERDESVEIIVATDLHYLAPELTDHGPFFRRLIENGDGKVMAASEELIEAFVSQVIDRRPDALILSGDLTFNGERASHEALAQKLRRVKQAGIKVLVIPGNHDLNNGSAARFAGEGYERVGNVTPEAFARIYQSFGLDGSLSRDEASLSYAAQVGDRLRVLMVDVNASDTPNGVAEETAAWVAGQLAEAKRAGCRVIAVSHQNLLDHSSLISAGFTISNAGVLRELYAKAPVLCNLSGHIHMQHMQASEAGLWDIATGSLAVFPNAYGVLTVTRGALTYRTEAVDVSSWAAAQGLTDPKWLDFAGYSEAFFKDTARRQALAVLAQDERPEQLADFFADINAAYFAGRMDAFAPDESLLARWRRQSAFLASYIESIAQETPRDHTALTLAIPSLEE